MRSLRFRLIFWNTTILAVSIIAVGGVIAWLNLTRLAQGIDRELADRARNFGRGPMGGPGGQGPGPNGPNPNRPNGMGQDPSARPDGQNPPPDRQAAPPSGKPVPPGDRAQGGPRTAQFDPQFGRPRNGLPPLQDQEAERIGAVRRPRLIDGQGNTVGPQGEAPFDSGLVELARKGEALYADRKFQGEMIRVYTAPAPRFGQGFVVQVARELRDYQELARVQWLTLLTVLPFAIGFAAIGGRFLTGRAMRPIAEMGEAAAHIGTGDFGRRIDVAGDDEFASLGRQFNEMAQSLGASFKAREAAYESLRESYEIQRRFVADASHELRTPLTRLQIATSSALQDPDGDPRAALVVADESARTMAKLVRQLLDLARADSGELRPQTREIDLRALAADVVDDLPGVPDVALDLPEVAVIASIDPDQMSRVLINLVENARRHTRPDGHITVTIGRTFIQVADDGEGIAPEHLPHVRGRFYRVDAARAREQGGSGLGLAIVDEIVRAHGGTLSIESELGKGTRVRIELPDLRSRSAV